jgi:hypothetical protein
VGRQFNVVPPVVADQDVDATIMASVYPHQLYGQHQVVFIDRGEKEGVKPGTRFFAIRRGDGWQKTLKNAGQFADKRMLVEDDRPDQMEATPEPPGADRLPDETYAEFRVLVVREHTAMAVVTASTSEIERGARIVAKKGY